MDRWGIERGLIGVGDEARHRRAGAEALPRPLHPVDRASIRNGGMDAIRKIVHEYETYGVRAVGMFPAGTFPQVAINDKKMYPIYAKCVRARHPGVLLRRRARARG